MTVVDDEIADIQAKLSGALSRFIGDPHPLDHEAVRERVTAALIDRFDMAAGPDLDVLATVLSVDWAGMPDGFDARALLATVSTAMLDRFINNVTGPTGGAAGLVLLERNRRRGTVIDWTFERIDNVNYRTTMTLKEAIRYVTLALKNA